MGNCCKLKQKEEKLNLTHPVTLLSPIFTSCETVSLGLEEFRISMCLLPGQDLTGLRTKECQDTCFFYVSDCLYLCVLDGHGIAGKEVVDYCENFIRSHTHLDMPELFDECESQLVSDSGLFLETSGTTAIIVKLTSEDVQCASAGDSKAVLGLKSQKPVDLNPQDKPESENERKRIMQSGGRVLKLLDEQGKLFGPHRVWKKDEDFPGLAVSRSIGDLVASEVGVISQPHILQRYRSHRDQFLILASDGLWDVFTSKEAVKFVNKLRNTGKNICELICEEARKRWTLIKDTQLIDDISCVILEF